MPVETNFNPIISLSDAFRIAYKQNEQWQDKIERQNKIPTETRPHLALQTTQNKMDLNNNVECPERNNRERLTCLLYTHHCMAVFLHHET